MEYIDTSAQSMEARKKICKLLDEEEASEDEDEDSNSTANSPSVISCSAVC